MGKSIPAFRIRPISSPVRLLLAAKLIERGADVNAKNLGDITPITAAVGYCPQIAERLVEAGAWVSKNTLRLSCLVGNFDVFKYLWREVGNAESKEFLNIIVDSNLEAKKKNLFLNFLTEKESMYYSRQQFLDNR